MMYLIAFKFIIMNISNNYGFMVLTQFWHNQIFYTYSADRDFFSLFGKGP